MMLNSEKCKEMIIDFSRNYSLTSGIRSVTIGEKVLERVEHAKMLGVTISNNLTWSKHVDNSVSKAGKRVYMLYQLKRAGISQLDLVKIFMSQSFDQYWNMHARFGVQICQSTYQMQLK